MSEPTAVLSDLFKELLSPQELRRLLSRLPEGHHLEDALPGRNANASEVFHETARLLQRRGRTRELLAELREIPGLSPDKVRRVEQAARELELALDVSCTEKTPNAKLKMVALRLRAKVAEADVAVTDAEIRAAVAEDYQLRKVLDIDLRAEGFPDPTASSWAGLMNAVVAAVEPLRVQLNSQDTDKIGLFAFAPQSILVLLGHLLGDRLPLEYYQRFHQADAAGRYWRWEARGTGDEAWQLERETIRQGVGLDVAIVLSLSARIPVTSIYKAIQAHPDWCARSPKVVRLGLSTPAYDRLKTKAQLRGLQHHWSELLAELRREHGQDLRIHIFPALPIPAALAVGARIHPFFEQRTVLWELTRQRGVPSYCLEQLSEQTWRPPYSKPSVPSTTPSS